MRHAVWITASLFFMVLYFWFGNVTYYDFTAWILGASLLTSSSISFMMTAGLANGLFFSISSLIMSLFLLRHRKEITFKHFIFSNSYLHILNVIIFSACIAIYRKINTPFSEESVSIDITGFQFYPELIASTIITLILFGIYHAKFLSKNPKKGIHKSI